MARRLRGDSSSDRSEAPHSGVEPSTVASKATQMTGDWRLADFVLCEAWRRTPESRRARVGDFLAVRAELIAAPPPEAFEHPVYSELAAQAQGEPALDLMREPEMLAWRLPAATIREYAEKIERAGESVIVPGRPAWIGVTP